jgi:cation:H+ antiporter
VGFGTSAPELVVSVFSALEGKPALALGNAYGSNIANIAFILGVTALIKPIAVQSTLLKRELPFLALLTLIVAWLAKDYFFSRADGFVHLILFAGAMGATVWMSMKHPDDAMIHELEKTLPGEEVVLSRSIFQLVLGMVLLMISSRVLVWGAVELAILAGVSELVIGLTVVAIGTSLPELASTLAAVRKGEDEMAIGNVVGSNLFNTLAVVGLASTIHPVELEPAILSRDIPVMGALTLSLFVIGYGFRGPGRINRWEGALLLSTFIGYTIWLVAANVGSL